MSVDYRTLHVAELNQAYRPQREWIDGRGILLVVAHFFSGIGAGAWVFSVFMGFEVGLVMALVAVGALSGPAHLLFLGRPQRAWRMVRRPHSSWIARGLLGMALLLAAGIPYAAAGAPSSAAGVSLAALSLGGAGLVLLYKGFVFASSRAIPLWRNPLLPVLYIAYGFRGGAALLLVAAAIDEDAFDVTRVEAVKLWVVASTAVLILMYIALAARRGGAARESVRRLVAGRISPAFYGGVVLLGLVLPLAVGAIGLAAGLTGVVLALVALSSLAGDFYVKYCVAKAGNFVAVGSKQ